MWMITTTRVITQWQQMTYKMVWWWEQKPDTALSISHWDEGRLPKWKLDSTLTGLDQHNRTTVQLHFSTQEFIVYIQLFIYNCFPGKNILSVKVKLLSTLRSECHIIKTLCLPLTPNIVPLTPNKHTMYHHYNNQNLNMPTSGSAFVRRNVDGTSTSAVSMQMATAALTVSVSFSTLIVWMVCCKIRKDNSESKAQWPAT